MLAELIDGTADADLCLIIALVLLFVLFVYRLYVKVFDSALVAAVAFFVVLWALVR